MDILMKKNSRKRFEVPVKIDVDLMKPTSKLYSDMDFKDMCEDRGVIDDHMENNPDMNSSTGGSENYAYNERGHGRNAVYSELMAKGIGYDVHDYFVDDEYAEVPLLKPTTLSLYGGFFVNVGEVPVRQRENASSSGGESRESNETPTPESRKKSIKKGNKQTQPRRMSGMPPMSRSCGFSEMTGQPPINGIRDQSNDSDDGAPTNSNEENNKLLASQLPSPSSSTNQANPSASVLEPPANLSRKRSLKKANDLSGQKNDVTGKKKRKIPQQDLGVEPKKSRRKAKRTEESAASSKDVKSDAAGKPAVFKPRPEPVDMSSKRAEINARVAEYSNSKNKEELLNYLRETFTAEQMIRLLKNIPSAPVLPQKPIEKKIVNPDEKKEDKSKVLRRSRAPKQKVDDSRQPDTSSRLLPITSTNHSHPAKSGQPVFVSVSKDQQQPSTTVLSPSKIDPQTSPSISRQQFTTTTQPKKPRVKKSITEKQNSTSNEVKKSKQVTTTQLPSSIQAQTQLAMIQKRFTENPDGSISYMGQPMDANVYKTLMASFSQSFKASSKIFGSDGASKTSKTQTENLKTVSESTVDQKPEIIGKPSISSTTSAPATPKPVKNSDLLTKPGFMMNKQTASTIADFIKLSGLVDLKNLTSNTQSSFRPTTSTSKSNGQPSSTKPPEQSNSTAITKPSMKMNTQPSSFGTTPAQSTRPVMTTPGQRQANMTAKTVQNPYAACPPCKPTQLSQPSQSAPSPRIQQTPHIQTTLSSKHILPPQQTLPAVQTPLPRSADQEAPGQMLSSQQSHQPASKKSKITSSISNPPKTQITSSNLNISINSLPCSGGQPPQTSTPSKQRYKVSPAGNSISSPNIPAPSSTTSTWMATPPLFGRSQRPPTDLNSQQSATSSSRNGHNLPPDTQQMSVRQMIEQFHRMNRGANLQQLSPNLLQYMAQQMHQVQQQVYASQQNPQNDAANKK